jgi:hypothetical protein
MIDTACAVAHGLGSPCSPRFLHTEPTQDDSGELCGDRDPSRPPTLAVPGCAAHDLSF